MALPLVYHWRNLFIRKTTTLLTLLVVAAVVGVFAWMVAFSASLGRSLRVASDDHKLIVLKRGATSESNSAIPVEDYVKLSTLSDVARDPQTGEALISPEMMVQVLLPRLRDGGKTAGNVALRGVTETAFKVHQNIRPLGRVPASGSRELLVGLAASKQFAGLGIGQTVNLGYGGDRAYTIVGHFSANGGPMESEIWGYLPSLMNSYNRPIYSSAHLRVRDGADPQTVIDQIKGPAIQLDAKTETAYWASQSRNINTYLLITRILVGAMSLAAALSVANTMFAMVAGRTREIAMLRTIGYSGGQILGGIVIEAFFLTLMGGVVGCLGCAAWLWLVGRTKDMFGATTFTALAFEIRLTSGSIICALSAVTTVGALGALAPAIRASRVGIVKVLREP